MVHLVITGGYGFLGVQAARRFLRAGVCWSRLACAPMPIQKLTLFDRIPLPDHLPEDLTHDPRLKFLSGNLAEEGIVDEVLDLAACDGDVAVIHFASMVSGDTELQPAAGWQANVDSQRVVLDALGAMQFKDRAPGARFLFTSSTAAIGAVPPGGAAPDDLTKLLPQNTYGFHKAVCELMLNDYSRRGAVDGRGLRLPVIAVRPGAPNAATTGAWSSVVREPLKNLPCEIPIPLDVPMPVASYQTAIDAMLLLMNQVEEEAIGHDRTVMLPALSLPCSALHEAARSLADAHGLPCGSVTEAPLEMPTRVVRGMGSRVDSSRALALGLPQDESAASIVQAYAEEHVLGSDAAAEPADPDLGDYRT